MANIDPEDLETFLIQAQLVSQKVKALAQNKMSPQQFDRIQAARAQDKRRRQQAKKIKQIQALEKKRQGRAGKGITKDYKSFCKGCHWEYQMLTPECLRCHRETITMQQRHEQLQQMVEQYKQKKSKREQRKNKWQMWQKTKQMLWKKTSNNYDKWEYFVSDSEEEQEQEPIVPKDDPNFKALQRDMEERKAARMKQTQKAKKLKQKGNAAMKQGQYQKAAQFYTLALEHIKDIKTVYTNRALAYIKLKKYSKAIKDCHNVIEYMEIFEKADENKDLMFKAHSRKALAHKQRKQFKQALEDCEKALKIYPQDNSAIILKKEIEAFIEHHKKLEELLRKNPQEKQKNKQEAKAEANVAEQEHNEETELPSTKQSQLQQHRIVRQLAEAQIKADAQTKTSSEKNKESEQAQIPVASKDAKSKEQKKFSSPVQQIKQRLETLSQNDILSLFKLLNKNSELISIFVAAKGITKCLTKLLQNQQTHKEGYLVSCCLKGDGVGEKEVYDFGIAKIHNKVTEILEEGKQINMGKYFILQDIFQVLIPMSLSQKYRGLLSDSVQTFKFLEKTFAQLITRHKKQPDLFSSFLIYMGNLCSGNSKLRDTFITKETLRVVVLSLFDKILLKRTSNKSQLNLKKNVYSLYANLAINVNHRQELIAIFNEKQIFDEKQLPRWSQLTKQLKSYPRSAENFSQYIESLLSLFVNITTGTKISIDSLAEILTDRYLCCPSSNPPQLTNRCLIILCRLGYKDIKIFDKILKNISTNLQHFVKGKNIMENIVRLMNVVYMPVQGRQFQGQVSDNVVQQLKKYISEVQYGEVLFCNTCNLVGLILPLHPKKIYEKFIDVIPFLITVAKDKIGNWRKNASILLAKLSADEKCKQKLYDNHGMEVLKSIAQFVK